MTRPWRILRWALLLFVALTVVVGVRDEVRAGAGAEEEKAEELEVQDGKPRLAVLYFHADKRCDTCNAMEAGTRAALERHFAAEVASGRVAMRVLNWQEPANASYVRDFGLLGNGVYLEVLDRGARVRWRSLDDVWAHAHDREAFVEYVRGEVARELEAMK